ncbi:hypothetical protein ACIP98_03230 [Streptomyces sp. NPDC088354]|uniref:hypothetical protein n=1 Tax=Streptomyces sp. NPDC088354 TaxID=3365856 RepID=UPI00380F2C1C
MTHKREERRPAPSPHPSKLNDRHVRQVLDLVRASGILDDLAPLEAARPGPRGLPAETVLVGLILAARETRSTNIDDAWECMQFRLRKHWLQYFGLRPVDATDIDATHASAKRFYDAWSRITTLLDPARHDRRTRMARHETEPYCQAWAHPRNLDASHALSRIANRLVLVPVRIAVARGLMNDWRGDLSVDTTAVPTWARPSTRRHASLEVTAGLHVSGGGDETFGYSATLLVAGHSDPSTSRRYPQLCMGMAIHAPSKDIGPQAVRLLQIVQRLWPVKGFIAGDLAYSDAKVENFHAPVRALGYKVVLDYKTTMVKKEKDAPEGTIAIAGDLLCPHTPQRIIDAYHQMSAAKGSSQREELLPLIVQADPYVLPLKQSADHRGLERRQCPAAGTSPRVTCPWAQERDADADRSRRRTQPPRTARAAHTVDLDNPRARRAHPGARPTVRPPNSPKHQRPAICQQSTVTVPADVMPKLRQELPWGRALWQRAYRGLRSHIEGLNGRAKNVDTFLHAREKRQSRGRVAQTLLTAVQLMVENLRTIESFLRERRLWKAEYYTIGEVPQTPDPYEARDVLEESDILTPPPENPAT